MEPAVTKCAHSNIPIASSCCAAAVDLESLAGGKHLKRCGITVDKQT